MDGARVLGVQTVKRGETAEKSRKSSATRPQREQRAGCQVRRYARQHSPFGVTLGCSGRTNMFGLGRTNASGALFGYSGGRKISIGVW